MMHLEVAVAAPLRGSLTYSCPADDETPDPGKDGSFFIGRRVLVPLGRRKVTGYVLSAGPEEEKDFVIKRITKFLDDKPLFHANMVPFFKWVADYYHYPTGLVIKSALPAGLAPRSVKQLVAGENAAELKTVFQRLAQEFWVRKIVENGVISVAETKKLLRDAETWREIRKHIRKKRLSIRETVEADSIREKYETCCEIDSIVREKIEQVYSEQETDFGSLKKKYSVVLGINLKLSESKVLFYLLKLHKQNNHAMVPLRDLKKHYPSATGPLKSLVGNGIVIKADLRVYRNPFGEQLSFFPRPGKLTHEQQSVLEKILPPIRAKKFTPFLLHGVTGCGKTEVYLRAAEETLAMGRDVLVLVPEIALATQLEAHFVSRFGDQVVLLHSGLTRAERFDQYHKALSGKAHIVIGARSALFAPLPDPGLIVVDEEHDTGFKQDDSFRYHGRDMAVVRARNHDAVVILGSATPSITSYANTDSGKYTLLSMKKRVADRPLPVVTIVDLTRDGGKGKGKKSIIRSILRGRLEKNLQMKNQSILLLNRRGFSTSLICRDCGTPVQCSHCNVSLTLHKNRDRLLCHYCGFSLSAKTVCFECRSMDLIPAGFGIERVEEEVRELFPEAVVARIDSDTAADRRQFLKLLRKMQDGEIDILIGTQMIAKGHHFPGVTLVGIVWADGGLSMPDFRAAEKTFQLITQVTGRAGRGEKSGEVIIQTMRPDHYAILYAQQHQYDLLYQQEMRLRRSPAFPPHVRLVAVRIEGKVEQEVQKTALMIGRFLRATIENKKTGLAVLGPAPAPLDKIKGRYRWQLLIKGRNSDGLHDVVIRLEKEKTGLVTGDCRLIIDVDPENMM
ncbi:replication restart helicase PriA [Desulfomarina sp.]